MNLGNTPDESRTGVITHLNKCALFRWLFQQQVGAVITVLAPSVDVWIHWKPLWGRKFRSDSTTTRYFYLSNAATSWTGLSLLWLHGKVIYPCEDLVAPSGESTDCMCWTLVRNRLFCFEGTNKIIPELQIQPRCCWKDFEFIRIKLYQFAFSV